MTKSPISEKAQYQVLGVVLLGILIMTIVLTRFNALLFKRFLGDTHPIVAILLSSILGFLLLSFLLTKQWLTVFHMPHLRKAAGYAWPAVLFSCVAILIDLTIVFPIDMNILFPESLLFYPVIALFVEVVFHVLPITLILLTLSKIFNQARLDQLLWISMIMVAIIEPTYQALEMSTSPSWARVVVWINLYLFNLFQLFIFKKFDFISMYLCRLLYYLVWHIIWGHLRIDLLFQ